VHPYVIGLLAVVLGTGPCSSGGTAPAADAGSPGDAFTVHGDAGALCDQLAARYVTTAGPLNYCSADADCWAYPADCAINAYAGEPGCYVLLNVHSDRTQFADMALAWQSLGCPAEPTCDACPAVPTLACVDGTCAAAP
jgi:hypothetical protein